ncbi:MAG: SdpI family protein [Faecalicatena sp.]|uniref:SdpI family protein n=1 Tax=Faecalicatena sp. TaxID=2005360 RepID=UPI002590B3C0|nr:SdpI family protein [Faecalicatena sp.]MCI6466667.1 SdpI family protein [Faecalicatena sp.]MDY5620641.1 SdpI family protein [Lachnospiraceae bacterium]
MKMKIYKNLNVLLLVIFILGTIFCYQNLPNEIPLFMQSPNRIVFIGISFAILFTLAFVSFCPQKISRSDDIVRNEVTIVVFNFLGTGVLLYYLATIAQYSGFQIDYLKVIILIIGAMMILIGNFLPQMPFRSRIGFKLPWILKDKLCWQKTHRFAGYTAIPFGIMQCLLALFVQNNNLIFLFGIGLWMIIVCIYSLFVFTTNRQHS